MPGPSKRYRALRASAREKRCYTAAMTKETIAQVLEAEGIGSGKESRFSLPENREAVCLVATPGDVMPIERLLTIELREKYVALENAKHERHFFAYDDILGLRLLAAPAARERVAGFGR